MSMTDDDVRMAVVKLEVAVEALTTTLGEFKEAVKLLDKNTVGRDEYEQRKIFVDARLNAHSRDLRIIEDEQRARRIPWTSITALIISGLMFAWAVLGPILTNAQ